MIYGKCLNTDFLKSAYILFEYIAVQLGATSFARDVASFVKIARIEKEIMRKLGNRDNVDFYCFVIFIENELCKYVGKNIISVYFKYYENWKSKELQSITYLLVQTCYLLVD